MADYYIKCIYGPRGQGGYPVDVIHFAGDEKGAYERFKNCSGFLIYETGSEENGEAGAKSIYAYGHVNSEEPPFEFPVQARGKEFSYAVKVSLQKRVNPPDGIPIEVVKEMTGLKNFQAKGGLLGITEEQFNKLCGELDKKQSH